LLLSWLLRVAGITFREVHIGARNGRGSSQGEGKQQGENSFLNHECKVPYPF